MHVHTPHSFSYFSTIEELVRRAMDENVRVLGINDFDTWDGFGEFGGACEKSGIFPSFGMEIMALSEEDQEEKRLINDPKNPGRAYLCVKGVPPHPPPGKFAADLRGRVKEESLGRMKRAVCLFNGLLEAVDAPFRLSFEDIAGNTASGWVRERHIAKAAAEKILDSKDPGSIEKTLGLPVSGETAALQEAIRSILLKSGGQAYVPEQEGAFLTLSEAKKLFLSLGGIPAYPVLADGAGDFTDWEKTPGEICRRLKELGYSAVEFIPHRNRLDVLSKYAAAFHEEGFAVTAGSEHNSPAALPLKPVARDSNRLPESLLEIFERGAFCVAAHQRRKENGSEGLVGGNGERTGTALGELAAEGENIIRRFLNV